MKEDIKILEEYLRIYKEVKQKHTDYFISVNEIPIEELENLIARYKEIEKNYINPNKARISYFDKGKGTEIVIEGFIPKSKIKEKIEELEKLKDVPHEFDFKAFYRIKDLRNIEIGVLQELLED